MKKIFVAATMALVSFAAQAEWIEINENVSVNSEMISRQYERRVGAVMIKKVNKVMGGEYVTHIIMKEQMDCQAATSLTLAMLYYNGGKYLSSTGRHNEATQIVPGTTGQIILEYFCKQ